MFAPFPDTEGSGESRVTGTAHGASGSDLLLVASKDAIKSVVSGIGTYRPLQKIWGSNIDLIVGDRLSCGSIICASHQGFSRHLRFSVEAGHGDHRILVDDTSFQGYVCWMRDLMAFGCLNPRTNNQIMLFDIGRGKIEVAASNGSFNYSWSVAGLALSSKIGLLSACSNFYVVDMRTCTITTLREINNYWDNAVMAGCQAFFTANRDVFNIGSSSVSIKSITSGVWSTTFSHGDSSAANPFKCIEAAFAWHPARGPLAIVVSRNVPKSKARHSSIYLIDPRRHTAVEVPGTEVADKNCLHWTTKMRSHSFYPGHAAGQPYIGAISHDTGTPSFLTL